VTLTGSSAFSSAGSYQCVASYASSQPQGLAPTVTLTNGTSFTVKGAPSVSVQFICVGN